jgi:hypothetical protein
MSIERKIAQRITRRFALIDDAVATFSESDFNDWFMANAGRIRKDGNLYTIAGTAAGRNFLDVVQGNNGATSLNHNSGLNQSNKKTIKDFGKEIRIGNGAESDMLVFRRVQFSGETANNGVPDDIALTSYIVVENNSIELIGNQYSRFRIAVARL